MRLLKILSLALLAVVAVLGGVFVAAIIAAATVVAWLTRRFLFKPTSSAPINTAAPERRREYTPGNSEVIDITATEVRSAVHEQ